MQGCFGGEKGEAGEPHACAHRPEAKRARNNMNKVNTGKLIRVKKWPKTVKSQNNINIAKKTRKREKKTEQEAQQEGKIPASQRTTKKRRERSKNCVQRELLLAKKPATTNSAKLEMEKWAKKNYQNKQMTQTNRENKDLYIYP